MAEKNQPAVDATSGKTSTTTDDTAPRFKIRHMNAIANWAWDVISDVCAVCRNHIMDMCIECQARGRDPAPNVEGDCIVAWGKCGHAFHSHCISRWLKTRRVCPLDNRDWVYDRVDRPEEKK